MIESIDCEYHLHKHFLHELYRKKVNTRMDVESSFYKFH